MRLFVVGLLFVSCASSSEPDARAAAAIETASDPEPRSETSAVNDSDDELDNEFDDDEFDDEDLDGEDLDDELDDQEFDDEDRDDEDLGEDEADEDEAEDDGSEADAARTEPAEQSIVASGIGKPSTWQPWEWTGWDKFPSLYFAAEPEEPLTDDQLAKINNFSLAIIEFRAGQFAEEETSGEWAGGDLATYMESQAQRVRQAHPDGPAVLTYRSGMWAGSMYNQQWDLLQDQSLFIQDERLCDGFISYPKDVDESGFETDLRYCRWDFSNADTRAAYDGLVADAALESTAGVFFDNAQSVVCDGDGEVSQLTRDQRAELAEATQQMYRSAFTSLVEAGKYPILSTTNRFDGVGPQVPWESDCPLSEESLLAALDGVPFARNNEFWMWNLGELAINQVQNSILEAQAGVPIIVHMPWFPNDGGCLEGCRLPDGSIKSFTRDEFLEFGMASFLVSMGPGSYFGFSDMQSDAEGGGWFDVSWEYYPQYESLVTGAPLGAAMVSGDGTTYTREFENGSVSVDLVTGDYSLDFDS